MGKVVLFAVLTMDGCLAGSSVEAQKWLAKTDTPDRFGIAAMKETTRPLSEYTSLTMLVLDKSDTTYFIEAGTTTAGIINGMARMHLLDEIILCTIPVIAGNGRRLFLGDLPGSEWVRDGESRVPQERRLGCSESEHFPAQKAVQELNTCSIPGHVPKAESGYSRLFLSSISAVYQQLAAQVAKNHIRWTAVCPIVLCAHTSTQV